MNGGKLTNVATLDELSASTSRQSRKGAATPGHSFFSALFTPTTSHTPLR